MFHMKKILVILYSKNARYRNALRTFFWRNLFFEFGKNSRVLGSITTYFPKNVSLGKHSTLNEGVLLNARDKIFIGDNVHVSPGVLINTGSLDYQEVEEKRTHIKKPVMVDSGVWICSGAIINPGVTIGKNSVIAAGSVVVCDVPENVLMGGVPAKLIKYIK